MRCCGDSAFRARYPAAMARFAVTRSVRVRLLGVILLLGSAARAERSEIRVAEQYGLTFLPLMIMRDRGLLEAHARRHGRPDAHVTWIKLGAVNSTNDAILAGEPKFRPGGLPCPATLGPKPAEGP